MLSYRSVLHAICPYMIHIVMSMCISSTSSIIDTIQPNFDVSGWLLVGWWIGFGYYFYFFPKLGWVIGNFFYSSKQLCHAINDFNFFFKFISLVYFGFWDFVKNFYFNLVYILSINLIKLEYYAQFYKL